jgi:hypothetical protein
MPDRSELEKTPAALREEREKRITDAIALRPTDRVPIICPLGYFPGKARGIPCSAAYYDFDSWYDAYKRALPEYRADMVYIQPFTPGRSLEILAPHQMCWPGYNADARFGHQACEIDNMRAEDYDYFIEDASDYMFHIHMSRVSDKLAGLTKLSRLADYAGWMGAQRLAWDITSPEVDLAITTLQETGREMRRWQDKIEKFDRMVEDAGFPRYFQGAAMPPFDILSHSMRGMPGTMQDIFRQPDKLVQGCEKVLELELARPLPEPSPLGNIRMFMTNTRGSDDFMSMKHFDTFYWPTFKKLIMALIEKGATPCIFFEGNFTSRLEHLLEFPRGKLLAKLDTTDIFRAKEVLKDHVCIEGNVPSSLLQVGTVDQVKDYCRRLIDVVGKDGGFILSPRSSTDEVKPENLKAMIDFTREYGVYR